MNPSSLSDKIFIDGQESGVMKALKIIRQYKLDIFNDDVSRISLKPVRQS
jgi:hypothetical protein